MCNLYQFTIEWIQESDSESSVACAHNFTISLLHSVEWHSAAFDRRWVDHEMPELVSVAQSVPRVAETNAMAYGAGQDEPSHSWQLACTKWHEAEALLAHDSVRDDHGRKHHLASQHGTSFATVGLLDALCKEASALLRSHRVSVGGIQRNVAFLHCLLSTRM